MGREANSGDASVHERRTHSVGIELKPTLQTWGYKKQNTTNWGLPVAEQSQRNWSPQIFFEERNDSEEIDF